MSTIMHRSPELIPLSHDHHSALVLARRCRQSLTPNAAVSPADAWRQVREAFPNHLEPHFVIEESVLLPALAAIGEEDLVRRVREDHTQLRALAAVDNASNEAIEAFGRLLETHVRFEERELFEVAQSRLTEAALEAVAEACRRIPRIAPTCVSE